MKRIALCFFVIVAVLAGCGKPKVTPLQRKQAANLASEAHFATNLHDWARAEKLYAQATEITPDDGDLWLQLGIVRRQQNNSGGAKKAYQEAADAYATAYEERPDDPGLLLQQAYALGLLGRRDDAKKVLAKARKNHPNSADVRNITDEAFERMMDAPQTKTIAL